VPKGALAIQTRAESAALRNRLAPLEHPATRAAVLAEREVLHMLRGGCSVPVGAHAQLDGLRSRVAFHAADNLFDLHEMEGRVGGRLQAKCAPESEKTANEFRVHDLDAPFSNVIPAFAGPFPRRFRIRID